MWHTLILSAFHFRRVRDSRRTSRRLGCEQLESRALLDAGGSALLFHSAVDAGGSSSEATAALVAEGEPGSVPYANLIKTPGFEDQLAPWYGFGDASVARTTAAYHSGLRSALTTGRTASWNGIAQSLAGMLQANKSYSIGAWVRMANQPSADVKLMIKQTDGAGTRYHELDSKTVPATDWVELSGTFQFNVSGSVSELVFYISGPDAGVDYYVDEVSVVGPSWRDAFNASIDQIRKRDALLQIVDEFGQPIAGAQIDATQVRHHFAFGSAINYNVITNPQYADFFKNNFEWAVMENESKWYANEKSPGVVNYDRADAIVQFALENNIRLRGHSLFWAVDRWVQQWVKDLSNSALRTAVENRLQSAVTHFADVFEHWDVNNEMLQGSYYASRLGSSIRPWMFQQAQALDPDVKLFVNEDHVVGGNQTAQYKSLIQQLRSAGAPVGGIGVETHFTSPVVRSDVQARLDSLAQLGLPIWSTEFDVVDADPNSRADQLENFYRVAFAHPSVEGILMWGFWAGSHWRGPNAAIVNLDWTLNEAGRRYQQLMEEWTTHASGATPADGTFGFRGFQGTYDVMITLPNGAYTTRQLVLDPGAGTSSFTIVINQNGSSWHNPLNPYDVNGDGEVAPVDALIVINDLNRHGGRLLPLPSVAPPFLDVNDDGFVSPIDALHIINVLNGYAAGGEGEGEDAGAALSAATTGTQTPLELVTIHAGPHDGPPSPSLNRYTSDLEALAPSLGLAFGVIEDSAAGRSAERETAIFIPPSSCFSMPAGSLFCGELHDRPSAAECSAQANVPGSMPWSRPGAVTLFPLGSPIHSELESILIDLTSESPQP